MLRFFLAILLLSAITLACSPIQGWKPKTPLELVALAEVVVGGTVVETGDSVPCEGEDVPIYTYSATIQVDCVHKGNVVCTSGSLEMDCQIAADGFGDTSACLSDVVNGSSYYFFLTQHKEGPCNGTYAASYNDIHGAARPISGDSGLCDEPSPSNNSATKSSGSTFILLILAVCAICV